MHSLVKYQPLLNVFNLYRISVNFIANLSHPCADTESEGKPIVGKNSSLRNHRTFKTIDLKPTIKEEFSKTRI